MSFSFDSEENRLSILPIKYPELYQFIKFINASHWLPEEIQYGSDKLSWLELDENQRRFIKHQIALFMRIDMDVLSNLANLSKYVPCMEATMYYTLQGAQECIHAISYAQQAEAIMTANELAEISNLVSTLPIVRKMYEFVHRYTIENIGVELFIVFMAFIEGVLFSASFASLQWLREMNKLPGITSANSFIMRDENLHTQFSTTLIAGYVLKKPLYEDIVGIMSEVINIMDEFVETSLPVKLIGMNAELMKTYVRFRADAILIDMGYVPYYGAKNPFKFMDKLLLNKFDKPNFFERTGTSYGMAVDTKQTKTNINFDD